MTPMALGTEAAGGAIRELTMEEISAVSGGLEIKIDLGFAMADVSITKDGITVGGSIGSHSAFGTIWFH